MRTYGECILRDGVWEITGEPHVLMRAKRVLPCVSKRAVNTLRVTNTPEHARDIAWFIDRYPMRVEPRQALEASAARHRESVLLLEQIISGHTPPPKFDLVHPVIAYFLTAKEGSDPVVAEVLGIKREQLVGVRDAKRDVLEARPGAQDHIRRLAAEFLSRRAAQARVGA